MVIPTFLALFIVAAPPPAPHSLPLYRGRRGFPKGGGPVEKEGFPIGTGTIGSCYYKEGITYFHLHELFLLSFSPCVLLITLFLSVFFVFPKKDLVRSNLICRYVNSASEYFFKTKALPTC